MDNWELSPFLVEQKYVSGDISRLAGQEEVRCLLRAAGDWEGEQRFLSFWIRMNKQEKKPWKNILKPLKKYFFILLFLMLLHFTYHVNKRSTYRMIEQVMLWHIMTSNFQPFCYFYISSCYLVQITTAHLIFYIKVSTYQTVPPTTEAGDALI